VWGDPADPAHLILGPAGDDLLAVLSNGQLLAAPLATLAWQPILPGIAGVNAVAMMVG
jgi:hypothetical protein